MVAGAVVLVVAVQPWMAVAVGVILVLLLPLRKFFLTTSRQIKRLEGISEYTLWLLRDFPSRFSILFRGPRRRKKCK